MPASARIVPALKRWVVLAHLYLGVLFSLLFVMWFASGVVLMYSPYPAITPAQKLRAMPVLDCRRCTVTALAALATAGLDDSDATLRTMRLGMLGSRPVWRMADRTRRVRSVFADTLASVPLLDSVGGAAVALAFTRARDPHVPDSVRATFAGVQTEPDQWTLESPAPAQLPMLRFDLTDGLGTRLYVSTAGAEVVTGTTRRGRALAWIGAIPHWIYPTMLRRHVREWSWLIIVLSALGTVMSVTGVAVGLWQWRWRVRRRRDGRTLARSPYRDWMMRWHHITGLVFGAITCTWIFSGMMSMNPGDWSPGTSPSAAFAQAWAAPAAVRGVGGQSPSVAWRAMADAGVSTREFRLSAVGTRPYWLGIDSSGVGTLVHAASERSPVTRLPDADVISAARLALGGIPFADSLTLDAYDSYYRASERGSPPLPVLRLRFADSAGTWLYVEPRTGRLLETWATRSRAERWLYTGLHDLDLAWLLDRRPLWDLVVILLSLGGLAASATGLVAAVRWLRVAMGAPRSVRRR